MFSPLSSIPAPSSSTFPASLKTIRSLHTFHYNPAPVPLFPQNLRGYSIIVREDREPMRYLVRGPADDLLGPRGGPTRRSHPTLREAPYRGGSPRTGSDRPRLRTDDQRSQHDELPHRDKLEGRKVEGGGDGKNVENGLGKAAAVANGSAKG